MILIRQHTRTAIDRHNTDHSQYHDHQPERAISFKRTNKSVNKIHSYDNTIFL